MRKQWTEGETLELINMALSGTMTNPEIGRRLGRSTACVQLKLKTFGIGNSTYRQQKTKHKHLRKPALEYFLTHSFEETRKHFKLTRSELKSIFTVAYRDPSLAHLRKDTRRKDAWTTDEYLFAARFAGVMPRQWIADRLGRSTARNIKERFQTFNSGTKFLNGMPLTWAQQIWGDWEFIDRICIKTKAGPTGGAKTFDFHFRIIPWVVVQDELLTKWGKGLHPTVKLSIKTMAEFQRWIHGTKSTKTIKKRLWEVLNEK